MLLSDFAANEELKSELADMMKNHALPHAIIIDGAKGTGKTTLANIIAQYCVCTCDSTRPCGICGGCLKAEKHIHPDMITADGTQSGGLSVDAVRKIRSSAYIKPNEAPMKVYILLHCDKMLAPAQNAFLKILEEPPANVQFIMTVKSASSLLATVRSRSVVFSLFPAGLQETIKIAAEHFPDKTPEEISHAAEICDGNIGLTLQMLDGGGEEAVKLAEEIFGAVTLSTEYPLLTLTTQMSSDRSFAVSVVDCLTEIAADCMKASLGMAVSSAAARAAAERYSQKRIAKISDNILYARKILNTNVNLNLFCTWLCSALRM